jgi:hypothetical protein
MGAWPVLYMQSPARLALVIKHLNAGYRHVSPATSTGSATLTADSPLAEMLSLVRGPARARAALFQSRCSSSLDAPS